MPGVGEWLTHIPHTSNISYLVPGVGEWLAHGKLVNLVLFVKAKCKTENKENNQLSEDFSAIHIIFARFISDKM